jgi:hypothetical protein
MVLVSYPDRIIHRVICRLGVLRDVSGGNKKAGRFPLTRQIMLSLCVADAGPKHPSD